MDKEFLKDVYGYKQLKEELEITRGWFLYIEALGNKKKMLPRGMLFYGNPGEGKTHLVKEYSKTFGYPVFVIEGNGDNILDEVVKVYEKAKQEKNSIVIIDEIDKLIDKDEKLSRIIMAQLDGFASTDNVLTLATCNFYGSLPEALLREGRFDRHYRVFISNDEDLEEIIRGFAKDAYLSLEDDEVSELIEAFEGMSPAAIRATLNEASLRYGEDCNVDGVINVIDFHQTGFVKDKYKTLSQQTAIHEAGHAIYVHKFCNTQKFLRIYFNEDGGRTVFKDLVDYENRESRMDYMQGGLAGLVAEEVLLGKHDLGCCSDLEKVHSYAYKLLNRTCINDVGCYCNDKEIRTPERRSEYKAKILDKREINFVRKQYKLVKRRLRKYKKQISRVADAIMQGNKINNNELTKLIDVERY